MDRTISAEKLLKWIEENKKAVGFWGAGEKSLEAFDNLTDAINNGEMDKCTICNEKKKVPTTYSAMYWPERFPNEFKDCPKCVAVQTK